MNTWGALVGFSGASGILLLTRAWQASRPGLVARVTPYVREPKHQLGQLPTPTGYFGALLQPIWQPLTKILALLGSTPESVERRLRWAGREGATVTFRLEQVAAGLFGLMLGLALGTGVWLSGRGGGVLLLSLAVGGALAGALLADFWLTQKSKRRQEKLARELPDFVELLTLAVGAGQPVGDALGRLAHLGNGVLATEFGRTIAATHAGTPLPRALEQLARRNNSLALTRLVDAITTGLERGTPLAEVLRDQAIDAREAARRHLLESAGSREIAMLVPVVFAILPITVIFALFPGLLALQLGP